MLYAEQNHYKIMQLTEIQQFKFNKMKKPILKTILCLVIILWGSGFILTHNDNFTDVLGIIFIILGTALYFVEKKPEIN